MRKGSTNLTKKRSKFDKNDMLMAKIPESEDDDNNKRILQLASAAVIVNKRITTPIILEIGPNQESSNLNVAKAHRNIFSALKLNDPTLKIITSQM